MSESQIFKDQGGDVHQPDAVSKEGPEARATMSTGEKGKDSYDGSSIL